MSHPITFSLSPAGNIMSTDGNDVFHLFTAGEGGRVSFH